MSIKLPFKAVFVIDYDQELIITVQKQVEKYKSEFIRVCKGSSDIKDQQIENGIKFVDEQQSMSQLFPELVLSLYFLERSFVKATYKCLKEIFTEIQNENFLEDLISIIDAWDENLTSLISIYKLQQEQKEKYLFQLTDKMFRWVDINIPQSKKHEYKLFNDSYHNQFYLTSDELILAHLHLNDFKKQLLQDETKKTTVMHQKLINNVHENKLSIIIGDYGNFEIRQFFYFLLKDILAQNKKILAEEMDFFKIQFAELISRLEMVFIKIYPSFRNQTQLLETISALRNTPSILLISEQLWNNEYQKELMFNEVSVLRFLNQNHSNTDERSYIEEFTANYLQNSSLQVNSYELQDLINLISKKSFDTLNYLEYLTPNLPDFTNNDYTKDTINKLPLDISHLLALKFKSNFIENNSNKTFLLTLQGLATISKSFGVIYFTKDLLIEYYEIISHQLKAQESNKKIIEEQISQYFERISERYIFKSEKLVTLLVEPNLVFDDEQTEEFSIKKVYLTIQEFMASLPTINFIELFEKTLVQQLENRTDPNYLYYFLILLSVTSTVNKSVQEISLTTEEFRNIAITLKNQESDYVSNKNMKMSIDYAIKNLESIFDTLLVQGDYEGSQVILDLLVSCFDIVEEEQKIRFQFQKARQFLVTGSIKDSFAELDHSIPLIRKTKSFWSLGVILRLMGEIFFMNRQLQFGIYCYEQIIQLHNRILNKNSRFKGYSQLKLTDRFIENGLFANALQTIEESSKVFDKVNLALEKVTNLQKTADLLFKLGSTDLAIQELEKAVTIVNPENKVYLEKLESTKYTMENPEIYNPLYLMKNWNKVNYLQSDALEVQERKYKKIFDDGKAKNQSEEFLLNILQYVRILFKLGKIQELRIVMNYIEHDLEKKFQNIGLIYLELTLYYNYLGRVGVANYYSDLTRKTLYNLPVDYDIRSVHQILFIGLQLYAGNFEYADFLIRDQLLRKKLRYESYLYLYLAYLEGKKRETTNFDSLYEKARSLAIEKNKPVYSKQDVLSYGPALIYNLYEEIFPITALGKEDVETIEKIHFLFYNMSIGGPKQTSKEMLSKTSTITELSASLKSASWKIDVSIDNNKRIGQIYYNDENNPDSLKKSILHWQKALQLINHVAKGDLEQSYLFEKLDLLYLVGSSYAKNSALPVEEANKYLLSGKNLIRRNTFQDQKRLEFQFDSALGTNFFLSKNFEKATKYYIRALEKHENKLYPELRVILINISKIYREENNREKIDVLLEKYKEVIEILNLQDELKKLENNSVP